MTINDEWADKTNMVLKECYLCYFDILGYRDYIETNPNAHKKYLFALELAIEKAKSIIRENRRYFTINYRTYSDNFMLFSKRLSQTDDIVMLNTLSTIMRKIQIEFLIDFDILLRGSITIGNFYADDQIVFGSGLIRAYELEASIAKFPRIIIDKEVFEEQQLEKAAYLTCDFDGQYFVEYFYNQNCLKLTHGKIIGRMRTNCKYKSNVVDAKKIMQRERVIEKHIWLLIKYNNQCERLDCSHLRIAYNLRINERLMKTEIEVLSQQKNKHLLSYEEDDE